MIQQSTIRTLTPLFGFALSALALGQQDLGREPVTKISKQDALNGPHVAELMRDITFPLADAISAAERYCGGRAIRADCALSSPDSQQSDVQSAAPSGRFDPVCVVSLLVDDGRLVEATVNARTGQVTSKRDVAELPAGLVSSQGTGTDVGMGIDFAIPRRWQTATDLIGKSVTNSDGETLGKIEDMVADVSSGRVAYGVHSFGNMQDTSGRFYPVPWQAGQLSSDNQTFALNVKRDRLKTAPGFAKNQWPDFAEEQFAMDTFKYYGRRPYWESDPANGSATQNDIPGQQGAALEQPTSPRSAQEQPNNERSESGSRSSSTAKQVAPAGSYTEARSQRPAFQRISELRGKEIRTSKGVSLGKISDVVLDPESGRILYAIHTFRGKLQPVPWAALQTDPDGKYFTLNVDPEKLKGAPSFEKERWPNVVDQQWAQDVHAFYNVDPFWKAGRTAAGR